MQTATFDIRGKGSRARVTRDYCVLDAFIKNIFPEIAFADTKFYESALVEIVVSMDVYAKVIRNGLMAGTHNQLISQIFTFGYLISGMYYKKISGWPKCVFVL